MSQRSLSRVELNSHVCSVPRAGSASHVLLRGLQVVPVYSVVALVTPTIVVRDKRRNENQDLMMSEVFVNAVCSVRS